MQKNNKLTNVLLIVLILSIIGLAFFLFLKNKPIPQNKYISSNPLGNCSVPQYKTKNLYPVEFKNDDSLTQFVVIFKAGTDIRLREKYFKSLCGADTTEINSIIDTYGLVVQRLINSTSEEDLTKSFESARKNMPNVTDLNLEYLITIPNNTNKGKIIETLTAFRDSLLVHNVSTNGKAYLP